ncbi:hypothetical protein [Bacteroides eggerthii]|uniref:hypothetical protein n=1 Tax=Bacteroides eggerthii TaxID=28111 RepID=UPI0018997C19|nr:hypothetical protein [Bacteroides eggerthii]
MNQDNSSSVVIYKRKYGSILLDVSSEYETVWLTQSQMSQLFGVDRTVVVRHIRNIYKDEELQEEATCAKKAQVQNGGGRIFGDRCNNPVGIVDLMIYYFVI